jgi:hypothetical protein
MRIWMRYPLPSVGSVDLLVIYHARRRNLRWCRATERRCELHRLDIHVNLVLGLIEVKKRVAERLYTAEMVMVPTHEKEVRI